MKSQHRFQQVVVLGSGVMGSQIAAHCVNAGFRVRLLDLKSDDPEDPDRLAREGIEKLGKMKPSPFSLPEMAEWIEPGNFDDHLEWTAEADWVCEAVVERIDIKQDLLSRVEKHWSEGTIVTTNTSGLPIGSIAENCSKEFRRHFLGTHFFNPPRYMKLLELIPTDDTDPEIVSSMHELCEKYLGKGVIYCNDTPNFIANRIGVFSMASILPWYFNGEFTPEEIDLLTGTLTGYSKAATFRTADMVGLDVLAHVADNIYPEIPDDERREVFQLPDQFSKMVEKGWLGKKSGQGFYKKVKTADGNQYLSLDSETMEYSPQKSVDFESVGEVKKKYTSPAERLRDLAGREEKLGRFLWSIHCDLLLYSAARIPEITRSVEAVDRAMKWGFNWQLGPFERWDAIGVADSVERMEREGRNIPDSVKRMLDAGRERFYEEGTVWDLAGEKAVKISPPARGAVTVGILASTDENRQITADDHSALYDMGDDVALFEFRTPRQTLGMKLMENLDQACRKVEQEFGAMVIGHDQENFSYGANLTEALQAIERGDRETLDRAVHQFQSVVTGLRYQPYPVVAAAAGMAFGGAVELMLHCDRVVAHHELYCGLVELGVGLIPGGGGTKEMLLRAMGSLSDDDQADPMPHIREVFKTIGMAAVSDGAQTARKLNFLREADPIVMHRDLLLAAARDEAKGMAERGYRPPAEPKIRLTGQEGYALLRSMIYNLKEGSFISPYDAVLADKVAHILTGGVLSEPQEVTESWVLKLEREAIFELLDEERTQKRMAHMLKTGKPLRN